MLTHTMSSSSALRLPPPHLLDNFQLSCTIPACHLLDNCHLCCVIPSPGRFFGVDLQRAAGHVDMPGHRVEDEEFGFRAEEGGVAKAAGLQVGFGALREDRKSTRL